MSDSHHDHTEHHRMMIRDFKRRFFVSIVLTLPVLALSPLIQQFLGFTFGFPGDGIVVFVLATVIFVYGGWPFLSGLVSELKEKTPGMMTLIGLAITVAYVYSAAVTLDVVVVAESNACDRPWRGSHALRELALGKVQFLAKLENLGGKAELLCRRLVFMSYFGILQLFVPKRSW